jgi:hypothetical protein
MTMLRRRVQDLVRLWLRSSNAERFDAATREPRAVQEQKLLEIVRRNRDTVYGRLHQFQGIKSIADYQARVPPVTYDALQPYVERLLRGEQNVLTAEAPLMFATTSGTTGAAKYIPVTPSYLAEYAHGIHVHTYRLLADFGDILEGRAIVSSSNDIEGYTPGGVPYGAISGYLSRKQPAFMRHFFLPPHDVCRVKKVADKYYLTLRHALAADVRSLLTPNPSSLVLLAEKMSLHAEELIRDIRDGSLNAAYRAPHTGAEVSRADPRRADALAAMLRTTGRLLPAEVWPNLRVISCWKGGTMPLYVHQLPRWYGDVPVRDFGYMASEGRGATPLVNSGAGGVLSLTSHFFEFVPMAQRDSPTPQFLTGDQLETDHEYYVYFTTSAGLYRYDINDVVRVVDWYRHTPVIQFVRKGGGVSSITGEKLTEPQVTAALVEVVDRQGFDVLHFTARVEWGTPPGYALYVEAGGGMTAALCKSFGAAMDRYLCAGNIEYAAKRESGRLRSPVVKRVAPGSYEALRQRRVAAGAPEAQVKIPHLSPDLSFGADMTVLETIETADEGDVR